MRLRSLAQKGLLAVFTGIGLSLFSASLETQYLQLKDNDKGQFEVNDKITSSDTEKFSVKFILKEGTEGKIISFPAPEISSASHEMQITYKNPDIEWKIKAYPRGRVIAVDSEITNNSKTQALLEPVIEFSFANNKKVNQFWSGQNESEKIKTGKEIVRQGIKSTVEKHVGASNMPFPAAAAFGKNSVAFAGSLPFDPVSYYAARCMPDENSIVTNYSIRIVADPARPVPFRMLLGTSSAKYGGPEATVQCYYDSFPEIWTPVVGQDSPYIWGNHGQYLIFWGKPDYETVRRLYIVNEWAYCPYKRSGDMIVQPEQWDYKAHNNITQISAHKSWIYDYTKTVSSADLFSKITYEEFTKARREIFRKYAKEFGWMFYNTACGTWCEIELARTKYPDAINEDKTVPYILNAWSTAHDQEIRTFPLETSFAKVFEKDMEYLAKDLELPGFALDCAYAGAYYRGPAMKKNIPGRAWDEEGVFIDQSVAIDKEVDFIHDIIKTDDPAKKLVAWSNGYLKGDYMMIEAPIVSSKFKKWMPLLRYLVGARPGCVHGHGYCLRDIIPNWRDKTTQDFKIFMPKLADHEIFNEFKYGLTTSHITIYGNPQIHYVIPEVIELMRAGWQAYIPLYFDKEDKIFYTARYGKDSNTIFFIGNPYDYDMKKEIRIDSSEISPYKNITYLFVRKMRTKAKTLNSINNGQNNISTELESRTPILYEAVCGLKNAPASITCEASSAKDINIMKYKVAFKTTAPFESAISLRKVRDFQLESIKCSGKALKFSDSGNEYITEACPIKEKAALEITYRSNIFRIPDEKILKFPFSDEKENVTFSVEVPENPNDAEKETAARFVGYIKFCADKKLINKNSKIPEDAKAKVMIITGDKDKSVPDGISISADGSILYVKSQDPAKLESLVKELFYVMDRRFEYIFPFQSVMGVYTDMLTHFKMYGKHLPYRKYFE